MKTTQKKGKTGKGTQEIKTNKDKDVQTLLNSILPYDGPSTSANAKKRRDAVDTRNDLEAISSSNEDEPTDMQSNPRKRQKLSHKSDKIDDSQTLETTASSSDKEDEYSEVVKMQTSSNELEQLKNEILMEIRNEIKKLRFSLLYDIKKMKEDVTFLISPQNKSKPLTVLQKDLNLDEPFTDLQKFFEFDSKIKTDSALADALREILSFKTRARKVSDAISSFVGTIMTPKLQMCFSGCGKLKNGTAKENFSATNCYLELKSILMKQFPHEKESEILSKTSRWFSNAKDRHEGRNNRQINTR